MKTKFWAWMGGVVLLGGLGLAQADEMKSDQKMDGQMMSSDGMKKDATPMKDDKKTMKEGAMKSGDKTNMAPAMKPDTMKSDGMKPVTPKM